jgi:hypothetical protein
LILVHDEINLPVLLLLVEGLFTPRQTIRSAATDNHDNGGKRHARKGQSSFEESVW